MKQYTFDLVNFSVFYSDRFANKTRRNSLIQLKEYFELGLIQLSRHSSLFIHLSKTFT